MPRPLAAPVAPVLCGHAGGRNLLFTQFTLVCLHCTKITEEQRQQLSQAQTSVLERRQSHFSPCFCRYHVVNQAHVFMPLLLPPPAVGALFYERHLEPD